MIACLAANFGQRHPHTDGLRKETLKAKARDKFKGRAEIASMPTLRSSWVITLDIMQRRESIY